MIYIIYECRVVETLSTGLIDLEVKEEKDLLIGYDREKKGYKVYYTEMGKLVISNKCTFQERLLEIPEKFIRKIVLHEYEIVEIDRCLERT